MGDRKAVRNQAKIRSNAANYRPIALISNVCKFMEQMIVYRLIYVMEKKGILSPYQSRFHKGHSTIDAWNIIFKSTG